jgi:hypothetical protein
MQDAAELLALKNLNKDEQLRLQQSDYALLDGELKALALDRRLLQNPNSGALVTTNSTDGESKEQQQQQQLSTPTIMQFSKFMTDSFDGDYLGLRNNADVYRTVLSHGDEKLLFSDYVLKVNRSGTRKKRMFLITESAVYTMLPNKRGTLTRRINIENIKSVSCSKKKSTLLVLHHVSDSDFLYEAPKRPEIMFLLIALHRQRAGSELPFQFGEDLFVRDEEHTVRHVAIYDTQQYRVKHAKHIVQPTA